MGPSLNNCTITLSGDILNNSKKTRNLQSQYTGTPGRNFFKNLFCVILIAIPFFGWAWALLIMNRYRCKHTFIVGVPLQFDGRYGEILGNVFKWFFFSLITLTVYFFVLVPVRYRQWQDANTVFGSVA